MAAQVESAPAADEGSTLLKKDGEKLSFCTKFIYSGPFFGAAAFQIPVHIYGKKFYSDVVGMSLDELAVGLALGCVLDALVDPSLGWLSDNTNKERCGRRHPYIICGAFISAITFYLLMTPPETMTSSEVFVYFMVCMSLWHVGYSMYMIPYTSLGMEMTLDYNERTSLFGFREYVAAIALVISAVMPAALKQGLGGDGEAERTALFWTAVVVSSHLLVSVLLVGVFIREKAAYTASNPLIAGINWTLGNKAFTTLLPVWGLANIAVYTQATVLPFWVEYVLEPPEDQRELWVLAIFGTIFGSAAFAVPIWTYLGQTLGKKESVLWSWAISICTASCLVFLQEGQLVWALTIAFILGSSMAGWNFLFFSLQGDVVDYDAFHTGMRREGQYNAFAYLVPKVVSIFFDAMPISIMALGGYVANQHPQAAMTRWTISCLVAVLPAIAGFGAFFFLWKFPIDRETHKEILKGIEAHERGESYVDPITQQLIPPPERDTEFEQRGWFLANFSIGELRRSLDDRPRLMKEIQAHIVVCVLFFAMCLYITLHLDLERAHFMVMGIFGCSMAAALIGLHSVRLYEASTYVKQNISSEDVLKHIDSFFIPTQKAAGAPAGKLL